MAVSHRDVGGLLRKHGYAEIRKIGEGSFGKALLVSGDEGVRLVCKMVDVSSASAKETNDAVKEGKLLAAFKHPYIVRYRDSFLESGWLCILMDYCEGGDLTMQIDQAKKKRTPIPEDQVLRWMTQAILALKYIHDKHVLHRDLKSGNFFLSKAGNLKMGDFGIAKVLSCTAACARTQIGTPYYLSPEVCQEKPYAWPADMWAMGCIFYELCERKVPFDATNISGLVQKICKGPTPLIGPGYSDFCRNLCSEMLNRNAALRPSAEAILQRPRIQEVVKLLLDEAQAAQEAQAAAQSVGGEGVPVGPTKSLKSEGDAPPAASAGSAAPGAGLPPLSADAGPYYESAGSYRRGDLVEYHSNTHKDWLPASVVSIDSEGRIVIDLKPNSWLSRETQAQLIRPRSHSAPVAPVVPAVPAAPALVAGGAGWGMPMRQRSPSAGSRVSSTPAISSVPGRGGVSAVPSSGGSAVSAAVPSFGRAPSPSARRSAVREPSPGPGRYERGDGSRAGTPGRAPSLEVPPRPGLPRVPGSPLRPIRGAGLVGMAIAGT